VSKKLLIITFARDNIWFATSLATSMAYFLGGLSHRELHSSDTYLPAKDFLYWILQVG
jgi:hypothetical protein